MKKGFKKCGACEKSFKSDSGSFFCSRKCQKINSDAWSELMECLSSNVQQNRKR